MQVDRKFIPLVCGNVLAVMDQHAADERVQLERLQAQVCS
jgi:DNA mismatch repair protein MLH3